MVTENHYRWDFIGLSTDEKPTPATSKKVTNGSTYYTSDDSKLYVWYEDQWYERTAPESGGGGGSSINVVQTTGTSTEDVMSQNAVSEVLANLTQSTMVVKELTTADYNDNPENPRCVSLWLLPDGFYYRRGSISIYGGNYGGVSETGYVFYIITKDDYTRYVCTFHPGSSGPLGDETFTLKTLYNSNPSNLSDVRYVTTANFISSQKVVNDLTNESTVYPLSANQGKVLKGLIDTINGTEYIDLTITNITTTPSFSASATANKTTLQVKELVDNGKNVYYRLNIPQAIDVILPGTYLMKAYVIASSNNEIGIQAIGFGILGGTNLSAFAVFHNPDESVTLNLQTISS